jgi:hypothetical protein
MVGTATRPKETEMLSAADGCAVMPCPDLTRPNAVARYETSCAGLITSAEEPADRSDCSRAVKSFVRLRESFVVRCHDFALALDAFAVIADVNGTAQFQIALKRRLKVLTFRLSALAESLLGVKKTDRLSW